MAKTFGCAMVKVGRNLSAAIVLAVSLGTLLSCSSGSDNTFKNLLGSNQQGDPFGQNGNSAITFNPVTTDFGVVRTMTTSTASVITLQNASASSIYILSLGNQSNPNFSVVSSTCPIAPVAFLSGQTCTATTVFTPQITGNIQWTFGATFGSQPGASDYQSFSAVKGVGATSVTFGGIDSIDQVKAASVRLKWTDVVGENGFMIFKLNTGTGALEYLGASPAGSPKRSAQVFS